MTFGKTNMKRNATMLLCGILGTALLTSCQTFKIQDSTAKEAFGDLGGTIVVIECASGRTTTYRPDVAKIPLPPCSTFKIVNALIGLETGIISSAGKQFYRWDGVERSFLQKRLRLSAELSCARALLACKESSMQSIVPRFCKIQNQDS